jgi:hypothetical protein
MPQRDVQNRHLAPALEAGPGGLRLDVETRLDGPLGLKARLGLQVLSRTVTLCRGEHPFVAGAARNEGRKR